MQEASTLGSEAARTRAPGLGETEGGNLKGTGGAAGAAATPRQSEQVGQ